VTETPDIFDIARRLLTDCRRIAVVGDGLDSDIAGGHRAGLTTVLVLTGTATAEQAAGAQPAPGLTVPDLAALADCVSRARKT